MINISDEGPDHEPTEEERAADARDARVAGLAQHIRLLLPTVEAMPLAPAMAVAATDSLVGAACELRRLALVEADLDHPVSRAGGPESMAQRLVHNGLARALARQCNAHGCTMSAIQAEAVARNLAMAIEELLVGGAG